MPSKLTNLQIIILAAGNGSRMHSNLPKVMHKVGGVPMLETVLGNSLKVTDDIIIVYSKQLEKYLAPYKDKCKFAIQLVQRGTADAVNSALDLVDDDKIIAVLYGDHPLITADIISQLIDYLKSTNSALVTLVFNRDDPAQYGRIITDVQGNFLEIIEFKNANEEEKKVKLCNSGIMAFSPKILKKYLPVCMNNTKRLGAEIYLTEIVKICRDFNEKISCFLSNDKDLIIGVNTKEELEEANKIYLTMK